MKKIILLFSLIIGTFCFSQNIDTVINTGIYKSYFCYEYKQPLYVKYKLYKGGGDCNRDKFHFKKGDVNSVGKKEYSKSGYDIGHLANAEDFAYDCTKDELTFRYYNALPQTPNLNRGIWKDVENDIRLLSQKDSLMVICGGYNYKKDSLLFVPE